MKSYYAVHMQSGRTFTFDKKGRYVTTLTNTNLIVIRTEPQGETLAIFPPENVLWIESVHEE